MIAPLNPVRSTDLARTALFDARRRMLDQLVALTVGALGFFCFMPYAAIPIGNRSAIQLGNIQTALMVLPVISLRWRQRWVWIYPLIVAAGWIATLKVALSGSGDVTLCYKVMAMWVSACLTIVVAQIYGPRYSLELMVGIAVATVIHFGVGMWQWSEFAKGNFPMKALYENQSFLSVQQHSETIARYTQRPFGIFPEPSAMSSSLAPWVLFWIAEACGLVRLAREPKKWQRALFVVAAALGLALIILSQSGHTMITLAGAMIFAAFWFVRAKATMKTYAAIVASVTFLMPLVIWFAVASLSKRMTGRAAIGNTSWTERVGSLLIGFRIFANGDWPSIIFGLGPGFSSPLVQRISDLPAVWSVLLTYIYETGIVGFLVVAWIGHQLLRIALSTPFKLVFTVITLVWLVGITITTSYPQLLPLWMTLGWLSVWPGIVTRTSSQPAPARSTRMVYGNELYA